MNFRKRKPKKNQSRIRMDGPAQQARKADRRERDQRGQRIENLLKREKENDVDLAKWPMASKPWFAKMRKADGYRTELIRLGFNPFRK